MLQYFTAIHCIVIYNIIAKCIIYKVIHAVKPLLWLSMHIIHISLYFVVYDRHWGILVCLIGYHRSVLRWLVYVIIMVEIDSFHRCGRKSVLCRIFVMLESSHLNVAIFHSSSVYCIIDGVITFFFM